MTAPVRKISLWKQVFPIFGEALKPEAKPKTLEKPKPGTCCRADSTNVKLFNYNQNQLPIFQSFENCKHNLF